MTRSAVQLAAAQSATPCIHSVVHTTIHFPTAEAWRQKAELKVVCTEQDERWTRDPQVNNLPSDHFTHYSFYVIITIPIYHTIHKNTTETIISIRYTVN